MTQLLSQQERGLQLERSYRATHILILGCIAALSALLYFFPAAAVAHGPSCVFHSLFRLNCPFCGMTRDFVDILHAKKPHLNPFSEVAAVVVYVVYPAVFLWASMHRRLAIFYRPAVHKLIAASLFVMFVGNNLPQ